MSQHYTSGRQGYSPQRRNNNGQSRYRGRNDHKQGYRSHRSNAPKPPVKLTFWQKILKLIGLYKPPFQKPQKDASNKATDSDTPKINVRSVRSRDKRTPVARQPINSPRLYVGNLSYEATENDLKDLFNGIGMVRSVEIIYNPRTQKSKGYAFVEMQFMDDAKRSVEVLHNQYFMGRILTVSAANERQEQSLLHSPLSSSSQPVETIIPMDPSAQNQ